ncbi:MAG: MFS transporter [Thaumarchaeota archaeon]|nr:MFS transporter [Nitrososphaerota archaeon]
MSHVKLVFVLIIAAYFLDIIDASIVQIALPTIQKQFATSLADLQWVYGAYALTLAGFLMLMGRAGDVYGQKRIFIIGLVIFTIASFSGGLAPSLLALIFFRLVQGVGAAMTTVTAFAIFIGLFPEGRERNRAFGIIIAVLSGGFAAGASAGGVLTTFFGWRSVMFVNVPIGIVAIILSRRYLPSADGWLKNPHLDVPGAATVTAGTMLLVYGLTNAAILGLASSLTTVPIILSVFVLAAFLLIESRSKLPLMPLSFISRGSVLAANTLALVLASIVGGISFILTIYLQTILGYSPIYAAIGTLPGALIFFFVGGWGAARIIDRIGARRTLLASSALVTAGVAFLIPISPQGSYFTILPGMLVWALGASIGFPAVNIAAVAGTKHGEEGLASGVVNTSFRVGFPIGLAVLLTVAGAFDPSSGTGSVNAASTVTGFQYALVAGTLLGVLGFAIAFFIKDVKGPSESWGEGPGVT